MSDNRPRWDETRRGPRIFGPPDHEPPDKVSIGPPSEGAAPRAEGLPLDEIDDLVQDIAGGIDGEPYRDKAGWDRAHAALKALASAARLDPQERRD